MSLPSNVRIYLDRFSLTGWELDQPVESKFKNVVVIPATNEFENLSKLLKSLGKNDQKVLVQTLILFVINNPAECSEEIHLNNQKTINLLKDYSTDNKYDLNISYVDASSHEKELPTKHAGVGLARKIGMDLGLTVFDYKTTGKNILICLDADCLVSPDYLIEIDKAFNVDGADAGTVRFVHQPTENELHETAILCYEIFLRYYVLGLHYAGSQFSYLPVGSTIVCDHDAYVSVQGMNKRKGGEDFYFLEKLAKHYKIAKINSTTVYPSARDSDRVPFGTGKRIGEFEAGNPEEYEVYAPQIFEVLKEWNKLLLVGNRRNVQNFLTEAKRINQNLFDFLESNEFEKTFRKIEHNSKSDAQLFYQKTNWFDAFRTLKLIHYLRDNEFPNENVFRSVDQVLSRMKYQEDFTAADLIPSKEIQKKYLALLRKYT